MTSLELYRSLIPGHENVANPTITTWLELAARRHDASAWGAVYAEGMVFWAAHRIERLPGSGACGGGASEVGPITAQSDGDLSRSYGAAGGSGASSSAIDAELSTTRYGLLYLDLRDTRPGAGPDVVGLW